MGCPNDRAPHRESEAQAQPSEKPRSRKFRAQGLKGWLRVSGFDYLVLSREWGMDPYSSPCVIPNDSPHNPFRHSLLRTRQLSSRFRNHHCHGVDVCRAVPTTRGSFQFHYSEGLCIIPYCGKMRIYEYFRRVFNDYTPGEFASMEHCLEGPIHSELGITWSFMGSYNCANYSDVTRRHLENLRN